MSALERSRCDRMIVNGSSTSSSRNCRWNMRSSSTFDQDGNGRLGRLVHRSRRPRRVPLFAAPVALSAQQFTQQPLPPNVRTIPPSSAAPGADRRDASPDANRPNGNRNGTMYPVVIDGSVVNRYLATPTPAPKHTPAAHHTNNGQDVFETTRPTTQMSAPVARRVRSPGWMLRWWSTVFRSCCATSPASCSPLKTYARTTAASSTAAYSTAAASCARATARSSTSRPARR